MSNSGLMRSFHLEVLARDFIQERDVDERLDLLVSDFFVWLLADDRWYKERPDEGSFGENPDIRRHLTGEDQAIVRANICDAVSYCCNQDWEALFQGVIFLLIFLPRRVRV